jgi:aldose 1-epimerase
MTQFDDTLTIAANDMELTLCPALGGALGNWRLRAKSGQWIDLLRPMSASAISSGRVDQAACFPLSPYSNRVRDGRFAYRGRTIQMPRDATSPHAEHGHAWKRPWSIVGKSATGAALRYRHTPDEWPFAYEIEQRFALSPGELVVELEARNLGGETMPIGFGIHPYFPRTPRATLRAGVGAMWEVDAEVMPLRLLRPPPPGLDPTAGFAIGDVVLDNCYGGWDGRARIEWPERGLGMEIVASGLLRHLVVYVPVGEDYFCVEPVSNMTDAFNLARERNDTGIIELAAGSTVRATIAFCLSALVGP